MTSKQLTVGNVQYITFLQFLGRDPRFQDEVVFESEVEEKHLLCVPNEARVPVERTNKSDLMLVYFDVTSLLLL